MKVRVVTASFRVMSAIMLLLTLAATLKACSLQSSSQTITGKNMALIVLRDVRRLLEQGYGDFKNENNRVAIINKIRATSQMIDTVSTDKKDTFTGAKKKIENDIIDKIQKWMQEGLPRDGVLLMLNSAILLLECPKHDFTEQEWSDIVKQVSTWEVREYFFNPAGPIDGLIHWLCGSYPCGNCHLHLEDGTCEISYFKHVLPQL